MIVVADTAPLNYLILIGEIQLLPILYGSVLIPPAVLRELSDAAAPDAVRRWIWEPPGWIETRSPLLMPGDFSANLGPGEREAIALSGDGGRAASDCGGGHARDYRDCKPPTSLPAPGC